MGGFAFSDHFVDWPNSYNNSSSGSAPVIEETAIISPAEIEASA